MEIKRCKDCACFKRLYYNIFLDYIPINEYCCLLNYKKHPRPNSSACERTVEKGTPMDPDNIHLHIRF